MAGPFGGNSGCVHDFRGMNLLQQERSAVAGGVGARSTVVRNPTARAFVPGKAGGLGQQPFNPLGQPLAGFPRQGRAESGEKSRSLVFQLGRPVEKRRAGVRERFSTRRLPGLTVWGIPRIRFTSDFHHKQTFQKKVGASNFSVSGPGVWMTPTSRSFDLHLTGFGTGVQISSGKPRWI